MNHLTRVLLLEAAREGARQAPKFKSKAGDITPKEALQILNLDPADVQLPKIEERFDKLFEANDPKKGGSFYLQSKVMCAKIRLEEALANKEELGP